MKTVWRYFPLIVVVFIVAACGYRNPNVYTGPSKIIYLNAMEKQNQPIGARFTNIPVADQMVPKNRFHYHGQKKGQGLILSLAVKSYR